MKTYMVPVDISSAEGTQTFRVRANSPEEAVALIKHGEGEIAETDVEAMSLAMDCISPGDVWED